MVGRPRLALCSVRQLRLASLYLLLGRNDERALFAYRIVREINDAMRAHNRAPEIVAFELVA